MSFRQKIDSQVVTNEGLYENTDRNEVSWRGKRTRQLQPRKNRRVVVIVISIILLAMLATAGLGGWNYIQTNKLAKQVPENIQQTVDFSVYLPAGSDYRISTGSFIYSNGILQFAAKNSDQTIQFAQQSKALDFDLSKFATGIGISNAEQSTVTAGKVLYGKVASFNIAIIDTGKTIITITSTQQDTHLKSIAKSMQRVR